MLYGDKSNNYSISESIIIQIPIKSIKLNILFNLKNKIYDGTNIGYIENYIIEGIINNDNIFLNLEDIIVEFDSIYPGKNIPIKIKNIKLLGDNLHFYYTDSEINLHSSIFKKILDIDLLINDKIYNHNYNATVLSYNIIGIINNDDIDIENNYKATFVNNYASLEKIQVKIYNISLIGLNSSNYDFKNIYTSYAFIKKNKILPVIVIKSKIYDGTTNGEIENYSFLDDIDNIDNIDDINDINDDDITLNIDTLHISWKSY